MKTYVSTCESFSADTDEKKCDQATEAVRKGIVFNVERLLFKAFMTIADKVMLEAKVIGAMKLLIGDAISPPFQGGDRMAQGFV